MSSLSFLFKNISYLKSNAWRCALHATDLSEELYDLDMQSYDDSHLGLQTLRYNKLFLSIHLEISNFNVDGT